MCHLALHWCHGSQLLHRASNGVTRVKYYSMKNKWFLFWTDMISFYLAQGCTLHCKFGPVGSCICFLFISWSDCNRHVHSTKWIKCLSALIYDVDRMTRPLKCELVKADGLATELSVYTEVSDIHLISLYLLVTYRWALVDMTTGWPVVFTRQA